MIKAEGIARKLPDNQQGVPFGNCYISASFVLVTTNNCCDVVFNQMVSLLESDGVNWLSRLNTGTSRKVFLGRLDEFGPSSNVIFKRSRFIRSPTESLSLPRPNTVVNELKANLTLNNLVQGLVASGSLTPPAGFESVRVLVEKPLGILVDKKEKSKYSIFSFESGFDSGEFLQHTDPPMEGAVTYTPRDWKNFCGIKDVLDIIVEAAKQEGLNTYDYDIHQVLYRVDEPNRSLELVLVDSERL